MVDLRCGRLGYCTATSSAVFAWKRCHIGTFLGTHSVLVLSSVSGYMNMGSAASGSPIPKMNPDGHIGGEEIVDSESVL